MVNKLGDGLMKNSQISTVIEKWSERKIDGKKFNDIFQIDGIPVWYFFGPLLKQEYLPRPFKSLAEIEEDVKSGRTAAWFENLKLKLTCFGLRKGMLINEKIKWSITSSKRKEAGEKDVLLLGYTNRLARDIKGNLKPEVSPVADVLKKRGVKPLLLICDPLSKNSFKGLLKFQTLLYSYIDSETLGQSKRLSRELSREWKKIDEKKKEELFTFNGESHWRFLKRELNFLFSKEMLTTLVTYYLTFKKIMEKHKMKVIYLTALGGFYEALLLGVVYNLDKKVVYSAHGYGGRYFVVCEEFIKNVRFAAWGNEERRVLLKLGAKEKNIFLTGPPFFDEISKYKKKETKKIKKIVTLITQPLVEDKDMTKREYFGHVRKFLMQIIKVKNVGKIVIKLHPREKYKSQYEAIVKSLGLTNTEVTQEVGKTILYSILSGSDLLISYGSTTDIEGIILDKNVMIIDGLKKGPSAEAAKKDKYREAVVVLDKNDDLTDAIAKVLTSKDLREKLKQKRRGYLLNSFYKIDGKSHERVADLITRII